MEDMKRGEAKVPSERWNFTEFSEENTVAIFRMGIELNKAGRVKFPVLCRLTL
jgi:hypothetical protein